MATSQARKHYVAPQLIKRGTLAKITSLDSDLISVVATTSDIRLKQDIHQIGVTASGLPYYRFRYLDQPGVYEGIMAQDAAAMMPDAVLIGSDGYLRVNYEKLGVPFRRIH